MGFMLLNLRRDLNQWSCWHVSAITLQGLRTFLLLDAGGSARIDFHFPTPVTMYQVPLVSRPTFVVGEVFSSAINVVTNNGTNARFYKSGVSYLTAVTPLTTNISFDAELDFQLSLT
jgi:hypothetical protein